MSILDKIKGATKFEALGTDSVKTFTNRGYVTTPLKALDTLIGGGIPFGTVVDLFGPSRSGKSSYGYEIIGHFQREYPEGLVVIIDSESSIDGKRLNALGVDLTKENVLVLKGPTMEEGYKQILEVLKTIKDEKPKNRVPVIFMWDSLSNSPTEAQRSKENVTGGGIAEAPRVNKEYLKILNTYLDEVDAIIFLMNQVSAKIGMFVGSGWNEAGGNALQHGVHYKLEFNGSKQGFENGIAVNSFGEVKIAKNKIGPVTQWFEFTVDVTKGGVIDQARSMVQWMTQYTMEKVRGNTFYILPKVFEKYPRFHQYLSKIAPKYTGKFLWDSFVELLRDDTASGGLLMDYLVLIWADIISERYTLQADVISPLRNRILERIEKFVIDNNWEQDYSLVQSDSTNNDEDDDEDE